jgi:isopentenyl diphosphate isomerase/L-lactate dehydrogenase-like FMN-dependent dehydrogenase
VTDDAVADEFRTIDSLIEAARQKLPQDLWDHASGGAGNESTLRRNREALGRIGFKPRLLRDVRDRSTATSFLGEPVELPVFLAPVGSIHRFSPEAALTAAQAAERCGTIAFIATVADPGITAVRQKSAAPLVFQLYIFGDREWIVERVREAEAAGCLAICLTVDAPVGGVRDRNRRNRFVSRREEIPLAWRENFTWADFDWLRTVTRLPLMIKGITATEDAAMAVEHGADVVYVSNHGGRQLDSMPASIEVLPEIVATVGGRAQVIVDSGFTRGSDIIKAIALGASAVGIGKLVVWSLAAGGEPGLRRALDLLREEMLKIMALLGVNTIDELNGDVLRPLSAIGDGG